MSETYTTETNFADYIATERQRLNEQREAILQSRKDLDRDLAAVDAEFKAINAYEAAKYGKSTVSRANGASNGSRRARRGSKRDALLDLISSTGRLTRGEILERMGLKGDKSGEMSISNALTALTKNNQLVRDGKHYYATAA